MNITKIHTANYGEFMRAFFTNDKVYRTFSNRLKERYYFMVIKTLSRKDPVEMHSYSQIKPHWSIVDNLHSAYLCRRQPGWSYGSDKAGKKKSILSKYTDEVVDSAKKRTGYSVRSLEALGKLDSTVLKELLDDVKQSLK